MISDERLFEIVDGLVAKLKDEEEDGDKEERFESHEFDVTILATVKHRNVGQPYEGGKQDYAVNVYVEDCTVIFHETGEEIDVSSKVWRYVKDKHSE
jgi:hypothetical protein